MNVRIKVREHYVLVKTDGAYSTKTALKVLNAAIGAAIANDREAALIDLSDMTGSPDQLERFEIGSQVPKVQLAQERLVTLAVVGKQPLIDPDRFAETVAVNRCAVLKVFEDIDQAISWLEHTSG